MKKGTIIFCMVFGLAACAVKKTATTGVPVKASVEATKPAVSAGAPAQAASADSAIIEKALTGKWVVEDVILPAQMDKEELEKMKPLAKLTKEKAFVVFNDDHTYLFTLPGQDGDNGTWKINPNGDITTTNYKGDANEFKSADLSNGKFVGVIPGKAEDKSEDIMLHFIRAK